MKVYEDRSNSGVFSISDDLQVESGTNAGRSSDKASSCSSTSNNNPYNNSSSTNNIAINDRNKLQTIFKRSCPLIPVTLTLDQVQEYENAFKVYDVNGDGVISVLELKLLLHTVGLKPSEEEVMVMIGGVDIDDNGVLSLCEFIRLMSKQHKPFITPKTQFEAVFRAFDSDGNGQLSREEFKQSLFSVGQRCSEQEFERLMAHLDRNSDGRISKKEFLSVFLTQGSTHIAL